MRSREADAADANWEAAGSGGYHSLFRSEPVAAHVLEVERQIGIDDGTAVLELGCGEGESAIERRAPSAGASRA